MATKPSKKSPILFQDWAFSTSNYLLFGMGIATVILGYLIMAAGEVDSAQSVTIAPLLLFLGYVVIIPISILYRKKSKQELES
ncbi:MAG: DUF3098 domain-containing protein [Fidelibacterota bacterium]